MFLRRIRIKAHDYLYVVENQRRDGRVVQRIVRYFGRATAGAVDEARRWVRARRDADGGRGGRRLDRASKEPRV